MNVKLLNTFATVSMALLAATCSFAQSPYFQAVTNLNPAGYWPMHEVATAAPGDIETNYGSLGAVGNAYYPDWQVDSGAFIRQWPGPLANGASKSVYFTNPNSNDGGATNSLFVPHTSPLTTLQVPFTIEMWFMFTNLPVLNFQNDIISQSSDARLSGFRVYYQHASSTNESAAGFNLLLYNHSKANQGFQVTVGAFPTNVWHYLVYTIDTNRVATGYLDGRTRWSTPSRTVPGNRFDPDPYDPLTIGNGLGNKRGILGPISEVAIYTNALSIDQITNHWTIGTNALAGANAYFDAVTNDHPILYYRMDSAPYTAPSLGTWPVAANYGSTAGNGVYSPGTEAGIVNGTNYSGASLSPSYPFDAGSVEVAPLSGVSSYVDVGNAAAYNPAGTTPFTVTAFFRGNPTDTNRVQSIVGHGTNSWELAMTQNGYLVFNSGTNSGDVVATGNGAGDLVSTTSAGDDGAWHWVVAVHNGTTNVLYLDGVANNTNVTSADNVGNSLDMLIGSDPAYTYNPMGRGNSIAEPLGVGAQFAGQVCDVAFFTNALTEAQVRSLYDVAGVAPYFVNDSMPIISKAGDSIEFTTTANGSALAYQWYLNTVSNYVGATAMTDGSGVSGSTAATVTITNYNAYYFVVATNNYGSITSQVAQVGSPLTVIGAGKPIWTTNQTNVLVLFSGGLDSAAATNTANYSLDNGGSIISASLVAPSEVSLTTSTLNPATSYTLTVQNVKSYYYVPQTPSPTNFVVGLYPANLALWVRADTNVTTDANGVSGWGDMSGNNNNLIGGGGSTDPQLATNALGDPVIRFSSANQTLLYANDSASLKITGDMSIIAVVNFTALGSGNANGEIVSKTGTVHGDIAAPYDYYVLNATTGATISRGNGNTGGGNSGQSTATSVVSQNTPHILAFSETGNTVSHFLDGVVAGTSVLDNNFDIANSADLSQPLYVGARTDYATWLTGDISELIIAGSAISSYDMAGLDTYLIKQHNLPITIVNTNSTNIVSSVSGNQLTLSWPSDHIGWTLQAQTNSLSVGLGTNWVDVANSASTNKVVIPISPDNGSVFYRLIYQ